MYNTKYDKPDIFRSVLGLCDMSNTFNEYWLNFSVQLVFCVGDKWYYQNSGDEATVLLWDYIPIQLEEICDAII